LLFPSSGNSVYYIATGGIPPSPSVYWNHGFEEKMQNNILESIAYRENIDFTGFSYALRGDKIAIPHRLRRYDRMLGLWMSRSDVTRRLWI
jgi:hypothetical protein